MKVLHWLLFAATKTKWSLIVMAAAMSEMLEISGESPSLVALHSNNSNKVESDCDVLLNGSVSFFFFFFFFTCMDSQLLSA